MFRLNPQRKIALRFLKIKSVHHNRSHTMVNVTLTYGDRSVEFSDLPENSQEHLVRLGFSTAIKNSIAGVKAGILGNGANPWSDADIEEEARAAGLTVWGRDEATALAICAALQTRMFDSIVSGETKAPRTRTPKLSDDDKLRRDIAISLLRAAAAKQGKELPAGWQTNAKKEDKSSFDAWLSDMIAKSDKLRATVEKEFTKRKKEMEKAGEGLDDIFA
jgi:hypothetical protein